MFLGGHGFNILIHKYFWEEWKQIYQFSLKTSPVISYKFMSDYLYFFLIGIHSMQGWAATTRHGVTRKEAQKGLQETENLFRKNLQLKDVC